MFCCCFVEQLESEKNLTTEKEKEITVLKGLLISNISIF